MKKPFKVTIHMVSSIDGFIAKPDNSISWFETASRYDKGVEADDVDSFLKGIDCYVMGARTYELAMALSKDHGWAYGDKPTIVLSHSEKQEERSHIKFYSGKLQDLVLNQLKPKYSNVWVVGGSEVTRDFLQLQLADEIRVSLLPIILGEGLPYFNEIGIEVLLNLLDTRAYKNGMVELCYEILK
ncbi:MAG TPA: dihydrofolate reductase family protein [Saprospiraceae bacterium]|nr:dihydrofolate reductase family protein [Saprospiraceae bacterium]